MALLLVIKSKHAEQSAMSLKSCGTRSFSFFLLLEMEPPILRPSSISVLHLSPKQLGISSTSSADLVHSIAVCSHNYELLVPFPNMLNRTKNIELLALKCNYCLPN